MIADIVTYGEGGLAKVQAAIAAGADVNVVTDAVKFGHAAGSTALGIACKNGNYLIVEALLAAPGIDVNKKSNGEMPLNIAVGSTKSTAGLIQELLRAKGARAAGGGARNKKRRSTKRRRRNNRKSRNQRSRN